MRRLFTLLELLVIIAITGMLAGMLLPALQKAKSKAESIACMGNLKQLGTAFLMYEMDCNGFLPPYMRDDKYGDGRMNWAYYTLNYYENTEVLDCPASPDGAPNPNFQALHLYDGNYGWNFDGTQGKRGQLQSIVPNPSQAYLLFDSGDQCVTQDGNNWKNLMEELDLDWDSGKEGANRHLSLVNIAFVDGHASKRTLVNFIAAPINSLDEPWGIEWAGGRIEHENIPFPKR